MRRIMFILLLVLGAGFAGGAQAASFDFRNFIWGVSQEDVLRFETAPFYKQEAGSVFFLEQPDGFRRLIRYDFDSNQLVRAKMEYQDLTLPDGQDILDLYVDEKTHLTKDYGTPPHEEMIWRDKTYANFPKFWARALLSGDLRITSTWILGGTKVTLQTYHDGDFYKLFYTAEKTQTPASLLNVSAAPSGP